MKHTPIIALANAKRDLSAAMEACPHWDYESDGNGNHSECCYRVDDARRAVKKAAKKVQT